MPWKECNRMDERPRFVARLLDGEKMVVSCLDIIGSFERQVAAADEMLSAMVEPQIKVLV